MFAPKPLTLRTEAALKAALGKPMEGRTCLVIAHRLSMAEEADRVVVLDKGRIAEQGRPAELLQKGSLFRNLREAAAS